MKTRNSTAKLIIELSKYGTLTFSPVKHIEEDPTDTYNCEYRISPEFEKNVDFYAIRQLNKNPRRFIELAALCFDPGFNPIFDKYL